MYRACGWKYADMTDADRGTPRADYIPRPRLPPDDPELFGSPGHRPRHTRDAARAGVLEKRPRSPKYRYWTVSGSPAERRRLRVLVKWPDIPFVKSLPGPA